MTRDELLEYAVRNLNTATDHVNNNRLTEAENIIDHVTRIWEDIQAQEA